MPIHVVCDACDTEYDLKNEMGGKTVRCPHCKNTIDVPVGPDVEEFSTESAYGQGHPVFHRDKFLLRQKHLAVSEKYYVWDEEGNEILFIQRPAHFLRVVTAIFGTLIVMAVCLTVTVGGLMAFLPEGPAQGVGGVVGVLVTIISALATFVALVPKRHMKFYTDDSKSESVLETRQDQKVAIFNATYTVNDASGVTLGRLRKNYLYNIIRKRWYGYDTDGRLCVIAKEDSLILALLRKFMGTCFGILRRNYIFLKPDGESVIGEFNRKFTLLDRYVLDMSHDPEHSLDRRLALALGVLLDTGEKR